ncbi:radical SAM protein [Magnetospirillum sp. SS-4]|uniref:B12-binding domain-containing radical SAM protein n=1 Tax=Magnetospirillum sp. SS-4 TaxID=2681465 RepID=UPI001574CE4A|nr:cobalamin-dependent protein [Magnetospirillum sp. SS-4]
MSKRVYFADLTHCGTITNADTFPYGVGCVAAYAKTIFGDAIELDIFKFPAELDAAMAGNPPDILCITNYAWNANLSMTVADMARAAHPHMTIVMGGPNICITPEGRRRFLEEHASIDFYAKFEGERAFAGLFKTLVETGMDKSALRASGRLLDNMLYLTPDGAYVEGPEKRIMDYAEMPSPYLMGLMDKFFDQELRPVLEFTRGCPYACTFCTDSHAHRSKVVRKRPDLARAEMEYVAAHVKTATDMLLTDLNFGQYPEDITFAHIIRDTIDKFGWPKAMLVAGGKSHGERVMECVKIVNGSDLGVIKFCSSVQSTDDTVLDAISRKNLPVDKVREIMDSANAEEGFTEYFTEIILGLPMDSVECHYNSLRDTIDKVGMNIVNVHQLTLLQGSPMALPEQRRRYQLDPRYRVFVGCVGMYHLFGQDIGIAEIEEVVVSNSTMTFSEWLDCRVMSLLVKTYIDRDYFVEVFGLIRRLGLSSVDLLRIVKDETFPRYPGLTALVDGYLHKTQEPLHPTLAAALDYVTRPDTIAKFRTGELGGNELLFYRVKAYLDHTDELHDALRDAALLLLKRHDLLDDDLATYLDEATRFSRLRKFDPRTYTEDLFDRFSYDFQAAKAKGFKVMPREIQIKPREARLYFTDSANVAIDYAIRAWVRPKSDVTEIKHNTDAQTMFGFGKLFHYSNLRVLCRSLEWVR